MRLYDIEDTVNGGNYLVFAGQVKEAKQKVLDLRGDLPLRMNFDTLKCKAHFNCDNGQARIIRVGASG